MAPSLDTSILHREVDVRVELQPSKVGQVNTLRRKIIRRVSKILSNLCIFNKLNTLMHNIGW